jgi:hypothetical protein
LAIGLSAATLVGDNVYISGGTKNGSGGPVITDSRANWYSGGISLVSSSAVIVGHQVMKYY